MCTCMCLSYYHKPLSNNLHFLFRFYTKSKMNMPLVVILILLYCIALFSMNCYLFVMYYLGVFAYLD